MKDALGHGSDGKGAHSEGVQNTPKLQRRHFEEIAAQLKAAPDAGSAAHAQRVSEMADKLSTTNPGFRRDYFVAAATGGTIPKGTVTTVTGKKSVRDAAYRNKGPGSNAAAVGRKADKFYNSDPSLLAKVHGSKFGK